MLEDDVCRLVLDEIYKKFYEALENQDFPFIRYNNDFPVDDTDNYVLPSDCYLSSKLKICKTITVRSSLKFNRIFIELGIPGQRNIRHTIYLTHPDCVEQATEAIMKLRKLAIDLNRMIVNKIDNYSNQFDSTWELDIQK